MASPVSQLREVLQKQFPDVLHAGELKLPLEYHFEPGEPHDGVTAVVPVNVLPQLSIARAEWLVPGLVRPKIDTLIRSLPKRLRTLFVPVNQAVEEVVRRLPPFGVGSFLDAVAGSLWKISGEPVRRDDFQAENIPPNLLLNFRVLDAGGAVAAEGRDLGELRLKLGQQVREQFSALADPRFTRDDVRGWDFGDLPTRVEVEQHGAKLYGFPTLIENDQKVQLRLLDDQHVAATMMPFGLRRLFMIEMGRELKNTLRDLPGLEQMRLAYRPYGTGDELVIDLTELTATRAFFPVPDAVRTKDSFVAHAHAAWGRLYETSRALGKLTAEILERARVLTSLLTRTYPPLLVDSIDDMRGQLAGLVPKRFLSTTPGDKLEQLPRYLRGIEARLAKLQNAGLSKDLSGLQVVRPLQRQLDDMMRRHAQRGIIDPALAEYRWMLEEFRISVFAQEIKTVVPVSAQKLDAVWKRVRTS